MMAKMTKILTGSQFSSQGMYGSRITFLEGKTIYKHYLVKPNGIWHNIDAI